MVQLIKPDKGGDEKNLNITHVMPAESLKINLDLISRNEETQVTALRNHYARLEIEKTKNKRRLKLCMRFAHVYNPIVALSFVAVYWILGLKVAEYF